MSERALPVMLVLSLGIVMYQQVKQGNWPPEPYRFVGVAIVFSLLAVLALASPQLAAALGVAVVIWLVLAYGHALTPATPTKQGAATA